jgi:ATP-dependent DNA ligase
VAQVDFYMKLSAVTTHLAPMEASSVAEIPQGAGWQYEPKWDGFRCLAFRRDDEVDLRSKAGQPLDFPELVAALRAVRSSRFVIDGEIVVPVGDTLSFDDLLQRIHPAASRIQKLSAATPGWMAVFDLRENEKGESLLHLPLSQRRQQLEKFAERSFLANGALRLSPATTELKVAKKWFSGTGSTIDGLIAKKCDAAYGGERSAMVKIKPRHTADCVIGGFRYAEGQPMVGSLLLGLYDSAGLLHHVGFCSGLKTEERPALTKKLEAVKGRSGFTGKAPGGPSRWSTKRSAEWQPLRPKLVVEVSFDHVTSDRFRHGTRLIRWRPDKAPTQCTLEQLRQNPSRVLELVQ